MADKFKIHERLSFFDKDLIEDVIASSSVKNIPAHTEILRTGQYVNVVPIVLEGLIKVFSRYEDKDLLLYYIQPNESCIMSFTSCLRSTPSRITAVTEEDSLLLLMPIEKIHYWIRKHADFTDLFLDQFDNRYSDLLDTINHLLFNKLDYRISHFLKDRVARTKKNPLKITHRQIASEVGTAREVVTRILKKLEADGIIKQHFDSIELVLDVGD